MSTLIGILAVIVLCFFIARRRKDHRAFINLLVCVLFGFIVGASFKSNFITSNDDNQPSVESIASDSMSHYDSSAVVWTVESDTIEMNLKNQEGDTIHPTEGMVPACGITPEIQNDS